MPRVTRTLQAERDLLEIWVYIAEQDRMDAADSLLRGIDRLCRELAAMPGMGRPRADLLPGLRSLASGRYVLYHRIADDGICLLRVLHGARDVVAPSPRFCIPETTPCFQRIQPARSIRIHRAPMQQRLLSSLVSEAGAVGKSHRTGPWPCAEVGSAVATRSRSA